MKLIFIIVLGIIIAKAISPASSTSETNIKAKPSVESTYSKVTPARHKCINMINGSRKLGSGSMIGGTTNYRYTNKHKLFGEQSIVCGIHASTYELVTVRVNGVLVYDK